MEKPKTGYFLSGLLAIGLIQSLIVVFFTEFNTDNALTVCVVLSIVAGILFGAWLNNLSRWPHTEDEKTPAFVFYYMAGGLIPTLLISTLFFLEKDLAGESVELLGTTEGFPLLLATLIISYTGVVFVFGGFAAFFGMLWILYFERQKTLKAL